MAHSLLYNPEDGEEVKSAFEEHIKLQARQDIEQFRLVDSWQNEREYWVYYELNKFDYETYTEERRMQEVRSGFDYWYKGRQVMQQGDVG